MKLTVCSVLLATLLVASSSASAEVQDASSPSLARRHHAKMQQDLEKRGIFSGQATWYGWSPSSMGACGGKLPQNGYYVALNAPQYGNLNAQSPMCNKQITITDGTKTTQATILDACPGDGSTCKWGSLDMSRPLFSYFNDFGLGVFNIRWWVTGEEGSGSGSGSGSSGSSKSNNNDSNDDSGSNDKSDSSDSSDDGAAQRAAAAKKAQDAKDAKAAAAKAAEQKKEAAAAAAKKEAAQKKAAAEKKAQEEAAEKKKEEAAAKKKAAKKAADDKIRSAQHQNIAAFGEIMQTLNQIVESAGGQSSGSSSGSSSASSTSSAA